MVSNSPLLLQSTEKLRRVFLSAWGENRFCHPGQREESAPALCGAARPHSSLCQSEWSAAEVDGAGPRLLFLPFLSVVPANLCAQTVAP
jgi:hypothetical protein